MLASSIIFLSIVSSAFAVPGYYSSGPRGMYRSRDAAPDFTDQDLFNSCPGGPGSKKLERADRCTLANIVDNPNARPFVVLGNPVLNCGGAQNPITVSIGGEMTVSQTTEVNANIGIEIDELKIGGGASTSSETSTTVSNTTTYTINPGRQAVYVAGTAQKSETGNIQVNYGDRQYGHFIWFTDSTVTRLTPIPGDVEYSVYESACGTDPRDLSKFHP
ncbi:hypothetical protein OH77DRAFT_1430593 [Trametes cingulata]|nr:hypothetical protein OH77DRAFT_1430593 [Trametes cingulata]